MEFNTKGQIKNKNRNALNEPNASYITIPPYEFLDFIP
jgi:hypothetical protein